MNKGARRTTHCGAQESRHRVGPRHLLQNGDEEANLHLSRVLKKTVQGGCALCFGENLEPCKIGSDNVDIMNGGRTLLDGA